MQATRPNECPRCGFAYNGFNRPRQGRFSERFTRSLREQRQYGLGFLGKARYAEAEHTRPFQCRCGAWLQAKPWSFGGIDLAGIVALVILNGILATRFEWARNAYAFAIPIGLWVGYRTSSQLAVAEVPAPVARGTTSVESPVVR